jgi:predicted  nucleic acid-binding Zn-ribbon protein
MGKTRCTQCGEWFEDSWPVLLYCPGCEDYRAMQCEDAERLAKAEENNDKDSNVEEIKSDA